MILIQTVDFLASV